jgi:2-polyprenyl-3-methyl-5-hydroxy-6-metoxy-1,4-benzoquinol methylase
MPEVSNCPVCGGVSFALVHEATFKGTRDDAHRYFLAQRSAVARGRIMRCEQCGFRLTSPQFEPAEYDEIYRRAGAAAPPDQHLQEAESSRARRLAGIVRKHWNGTGRMLDFGCGRGRFLAELGAGEMLGFEVAPSPAHAQLPCPVVTGDFLALAGQPPFDAGTFSLVTAWDVFEHLPGIDAYVSALASLLQPGGLLCASVPDVESLTAKLTGAKWNSYLLEHLWYFSPETLERFMAKHGFRRIEHGTIPYDAPIGHLVRRVAQTYRLPVGRLAGRLGEVIAPVPVGLMYGVFVRTA